jgi:predicted  nucleic acid-binding Zn-ribbon protein
MPHECTDCGRAFEDGSKEMLSGCPNCGGTTFQFRPEGTDQSEETDEPPEPPEPEVDGVARTVGNAASAVRNLVTGGGQAATTDADELGPEVTPSGDASAGASESARQSVEGGGSGVAVDDSESDDRDVTEPSGPEWPGEQAETDDGQEVTTTPPGTAKEGPAGSDASDDIFEAEETLSAVHRPHDRPPVPDPRPLSARPEADTESEDDESTADGDTLTAEDPDERPSLSELRAELNDQFESIRVVEPGQYELNLMELYDREEYIIALQEDGRYTIQVPERWHDD